MHKAKKASDIVSPQRKQTGRITEQDLKTQAEFLKAVTETNPDMISVVNLRTHELEFINRKAFVTQGFGTETDHFEQRENQTRRNAIHPDDRKATENYFKSFLKMNDGDVQHLEYRATNDYGQLHWFYVQGKVFRRNQKGTPTHCINIVHNITEKKNAELEIKASKDSLQRIIDAPNVGISLMKAIRNKKGQIKDFQIEYVNRRTLDAFGGNDPTNTLVSSFGADGKEQMPHLKDAVETNKKNSYTRKAASGIVEGWFLFSNAPLGNDRLVQVWEDITDFKKAEQEILQLKEDIGQIATNKYYSIFNSINEGFCIYELIYDNTGKPVDLLWVEVNPAYEKQTGLKNIVGKRHSDLSMNTERYWFEIYDKVAKTGEAIHFENWHEPTKRWYNTFSSRIGGATSTQVAVLFSDVTERKQREQSQDFFLKLSDELRPFADPVIIQQTAMRVLGQYLKVDRAFYAEVVDDDTVVIGSNYANNVFPIVGQLKFSDFDTKLMDLYENGQIAVVYDAYSDPRFNEKAVAGWKAAGARSGIGVPLLKEGKIRGILNVHQLKVRQWTTTEIELLKETAERTWAAIERAKTEEALKKSEEKYRLLFTTIDEGYCLIEVILNEEGKPIDELFLEINPAYEKHTGITQDIVGKRSSEVIQNREPQWLDFFGNVAITGKPNRLEYHVDSIDRWLSAYASRVGGDNSLKVAVVFTDITDRKLLEQRREYLLKLSDALRPLSKSTEIERIACKLLGKELKADRVFYSEFNEDDGLMNVLQGYLSGNSPSYEENHPLAPFEWAIPLYKKGKPISITDTRTSDLIPKADRAAMQKAEVISYLVTPIIKNELLASTLSVTESTTRKWKENEILLLIETAERIWYSTERAKIEAALRITDERTRAQKEALQSVVNGASLSKSLNILSAMVLKETAEEARTAFYIANSDNTRLHTIRGAGNMPDSYADQVDGFLIGLDSLACGLAIPSGMPVLTRDVQEEPLWEPWLYMAEQNDYRGCWSFPIKTRDNKSVGSFAMYFRTPKDAQANHISMADVVTQTAAVIIANHTEMQQRTKVEKALYKSQELLRKELKGAKLLQLISNRIIGDEDIQSLYEGLLQAAVDIMQSDMASLQILNPEKTELHLQAYKNFHPQSAAYWQTVTAGSGSVCGEALRKHSRITINDIEQADFAKGELDIFRLSEIRAVQSTPLISSNGKQTGMLNTQWKQPHNFSEEDFRLFDVLARQAADLIERKQTQEEQRIFSLQLEQEVFDRTGELKESREELQSKNKQLQHTVSQLESFNYIASHDLQEPLRKVQTFANLLTEFNLDNKELNSFINGINDSAVRMSDLIESLLTYSRTAQMKDAFQPVNLNQVLEDVKTDFEIIIKEKEAIIQSDVLPIINAIPFQMHQLFANLISNSLKFSKRKPEIQITSKIVSGEEIKSKNGFNPMKKYTELKIIDNGIGFDNQYSEKIFQVFQRLHSKSEYSGTGIGLSIVERIINNHNGYIEATSEDGKGAMFTIYLMV